MEAKVGWTGKNAFQWLSETKWRVLSTIFIWFSLVKKLHYTVFVIVSAAINNIMWLQNSFSCKNRWYRLVLNIYVPRQPYSWSLFGNIKLTPNTILSAYLTSNQNGTSLKSSSSIWVWEFGLCAIWPVIIQRLNNCQLGRTASWR